MWRGRVFTASIRVDLREPRDDITQQEQDDQAAYGNQKKWINRGGDQFLLEYFHLLRITDITHQRFRQITGPFAGAHHGRVQQGKLFRMVRQRSGKRLACVQGTEDCLKQGANFRTVFFLRNSLQRFDQAESCLHQRVQLLTEQQ